MHHGAIGTTAGPQRDRSQPFAAACLFADQRFRIVGLSFLGHCSQLVMNLSQALASVYARVPRGVHLGLGDVRRACERAGNPHLAYPVVHVAGTNGKGSVAAMTASVLRRSGYRVGLFTSPHLCRFAERIQIDSEPIADDALGDALGRAIDLGPPLSFFETAFLAAALAFRDAMVDVAVVEVGLGGRLDATNIVPRPLAAGVTRIALDHMDKLGESLEAIAREKAAIAKPGTPMVFGPMPFEVDAAVRTTARQCGATEFFGLGQELRVRSLGNHEIEIDLPDGRQSIAVRPMLAGEHQLDNAAVAAALCALAGRSLRNVDVHQIAEGIATTEWPARLETLSDGAGRVLLDVAHNPDGACSLARFLMEESRGRGVDPEQTALVFGAVADKHWIEMLTILAPTARHRFYVEPGGRKAAPTVEMAKLFAGASVGSVESALVAARRAVGRDGLVVVGGSVFLAGAARAGLLGLQRDPAVGL